MLITHSIRCFGDSVVGLEKYSRGEMRLDPVREESVYTAVMREERNVLHQHGWSQREASVKVLEPLMSERSQLLCDASQRFDLAFQPLSPPPAAAHRQGWGGRITCHAASKCAAGPPGSIKAQQTIMYNRNVWHPQLILSWRPALRRSAHLRNTPDINTHPVSCGPTKQSVPHVFVALN